MAVQVIKKGKDFADIWKEAKKDILNTANTIIPSTAKTLVRKDTAQLAQSIEGRIKGNQQITGTNMVYAAAQEFGLASKGKPNYRFTPYLRPALKKFDVNIGKIIARAFRRAI